MNSNNYRIIDRPIVHHANDYNQVFDIACSLFHKEDAIRCICTFGNINKPGISDIDLLFVFKDGYKSNLDLLSITPKSLRYLFTHNAMALNEAEWSQNKLYGLWDNQKTLIGDEPNSNLTHISQDQYNSLKVQTALEFLLVNYIDLKIQQRNKTIKLRSLLQHTKGLQYDLDYLNIQNSPISPFIDQAKSWIKNWFEIIPNDKAITSWFESFVDTYTIETEKIFNNNSIFLPQLNQYPFSKSISLKKGSQIKFETKGVQIPSFILGNMGKYGVKLQNKISTTTVYVPFEYAHKDSIIEERFVYFKKMKSYNNEYFPNLSSLTTSLISKII